MKYQQVYFHSKNIAKMMEHCLHAKLMNIEDNRREFHIVLIMNFSGFFVIQCTLIVRAKIHEFVLNG